MVDIKIGVAGGRAIFGAPALGINPPKADEVKVEKSPEHKAAIDETNDEAGNKSDQDFTGL